MISNSQLYRNQSIGANSPLAQNNNNNNLTQINNSSLKQFPPNINKHQLKDLILSNYKKYIKNPVKINKIRDIIDSHFEQNRNIDELVFKQIKTDVQQNFGNLELKNNLRTQSNPALLAENMKIKAQNQQKAKKQMDQKRKNEQNNEDSRFPNINPSNNRSSVQDIRDIKEDNDNQKRLNTDNNIQQQYKEVNNSDKNLQEDNNDNQSEKSVYLAQNVDEYTIMIKNDTKRYEQEKQQKVQKIKQNQQMVKKELDGQVKGKKKVNQSLRNEEKNLENQLALQIMQNFDEKEQLKKQRKQQLAVQVEKTRKQQLEEQEKRKKQQKELEQQKNQLIVDNAKKEFERIQNEKKNKRINEYRFYEEVKKQDEDYKQNLPQYKYQIGSKSTKNQVASAQSLDFSKNNNNLIDSQLNNNNNSVLVQGGGDVSSQKEYEQNIYFQKNYGNISGNYSRVYNHDRKSNNVGLSQHFENNSKLRVQEQKKRYEHIEALTRPLQSNFSIADPKREREEEKKHYQQVFAGVEQQIQNEKNKIFEKKMNNRHEINHDLDIQVQDNIQKKNQAKQMKLEQAHMWEDSKNIFEEQDRIKKEKLRQRNLELKQFLESQIQSKNQKKVGNQHMSNEELLINKKGLKSIAGNESEAFQKQTTNQYRRLIPQK